jgi:hypothetical protein
MFWTIYCRLLLERSGYTVVRNEDCQVSPVIRTEFNISASPDLLLSEDYVTMKLSLFWNKGSAMDQVGFEPVNLESSGKNANHYKNLVIKTEIK